MEEKKSLNKLVHQFLSNRTLFRMYVGLLVFTCLLVVFSLCSKDTFSFSMIMLCISVFVVILSIKQKNKLDRAKGALLQRMTEIHEEAVNHRTNLLLAKSEFEKNSSGVVAISLNGNIGKPLAEAHAFLEPLLNNASSLPKLENNQIMKMDYLAIHKKLFDLVERISLASKTLKEEIERNSIDADFGDGFWMNI